MIGEIRGSFANNTFTCNLGTIPPGATATVSLQVRPTQTGSATHTTTDPVQTSNTSAINLAVAARPTLVLRPATKNVTLRWPATAEGLNLEFTPSLAPPDNWITRPASLRGGTLESHYPISPGNSYYRLRRP